jgi:hypothetical protein
VRFFSEMLSKVDSAPRMGEVMCLFIIDLFHFGLGYVVEAGVIKLILSIDIVMVNAIS